MCHSLFVIDNYQINGRFIIFIYYLHSLHIVRVSIGRGKTNSKPVIFKRGLLLGANSVAIDINSWGGEGLWHRSGTRVQKHVAEAQTSWARTVLHSKGRTTTLHTPKPNIYSSACCTGILQAPRRQLLETHFLNHMVFWNARGEEEQLTSVC